ncbi:MAG: hypothetical protein CMJ35_13750 [Phycisphaerae bacterium]|nr:hypothetical protein [Phycisphaerae bacterium]MBM91478.1 hypothetical protein [Phycisphaerae bacterium]MBM92653.1 hypothetical protein [Phycisphaerae bacterium]
MVHHHRHPAGTRRTGAFTLIELLVVIALIAVLMTLVLSGLNRASKTARRTASQRSAAALAQAVDQFKKEFGFLPPLVHDGITISGGDDQYRPADFRSGGSLNDGPVFQADDPNVSYNYKTIIVWNEGLDFEFLTGRPGPYDAGWTANSAWDDRRYSKYALAYYLTGVLNKDTDGVSGPGMARPIIDGTFLGVGYPVGSVRDKYEPFMDVERRGARIVGDYVEPKEIPEHDSGADPVDLDSYESVLDSYEDYQRPALFAFVDGFGNAFRYYRWEQGRYVNGRYIVEEETDLNIPPVLIDPVEYAKVQNDPMNLDNNGVDFIGEDSRLRNARYAIVSAGPDGFFGTEHIETIANYLGEEVPTSIEEQAELRQKVWADNAYEVGN